MSFILYFSNLTGNKIVIINVTVFNVHYGRDSVVVSSPDSQSGGNGFDSRRRSTYSGLTKPVILSGSANWYQF